MVRARRHQTGRPASRRDCWRARGRRGSGVRRGIDGRGEGGGWKVSRVAISSSWGEGSSRKKRLGAPMIHPTREHNDRYTLAITNACLSPFDTTDNHGSVSFAWPLPSSERVQLQCVCARVAHARWATRILETGRAHRAPPIRSVARRQKEGGRR